jgi:hypothetical protein
VWASPSCEGESALVVHSYSALIISLYIYHVKERIKGPYDLYEHDACIYSFNPEEIFVSFLSPSIIGTSI